MPLIVLVIGALTATMLAALIAFIAGFGGGLLIWIKPINTCRGTEFGTLEGAAGQLLALALISKDTPSAIARMVSTTNTLQSPEMREWRIKYEIYIQARIHSRNAASRKRCARSASLYVILPHTVGAPLKRRTASPTRRPPRPSTATELLRY